MLLLIFGRFVHLTRSVLEEDNDYLVQEIFNNAMFKGKTRGEKQRGKKLNFGHKLLQILQKCIFIRSHEIVVMFIMVINVGTSLPEKLIIKISR